MSPSSEERFVGVRAIRKRLASHEEAICGPASYSEAACELSEAACELLGNDFWACELFGSELFGNGLRATRKGLRAIRKQPVSSSEAICGLASGSEERSEVLRAAKEVQKPASAGLRVTGLRDCWLATKKRFVGLRATKKICGPASC